MSDWDFITQSFGRGVQSVCGLKGILIQNESQNAEYFRRVFGKIDTVYFFMPIPRIDIKTRLTMDHDEEVTEDMICERCRENFEVHHRDIRRTNTSFPILPCRRFTISESTPLLCCHLLNVLVPDAVFHTPQ
jgi:hypothetical protein